jgi:chromatin structure-remodeling complex subunit RSC3/30
MATPRRNGKLSSCEPCRKSKLRCDHKSPVCDRCITRDQATQCFYHPAPLTRLTTTNLLPQTPPVAQRSKRRRPHNQVVFRLDKIVSPVKARSHTLAIPSLPEVTPSDTYLSQRIRMPSERRPLAPGIMGIAFPGEILAEQHRHSNLCDEDQQYQFQDNCPMNQSAADMEKIRSGMEILRELDKMDWLQSVIAIKNKTCPGWFMGPSWTNSLFIAIENLYDSTVRNSSDIQSSLLALSRTLFSNATTKVEINAKMTLSEYSSLIANRWETVGVLFAMLASATFCISEDDEIFTRMNPWKMDRNQLRSSSMAISEKCLQHCHTFGLPNDPMCWLVAQQTVLLNHMVGPSGTYCLQLAILLIWHMF